jgi:hypothetical protein
MDAVGAKRHGDVHPIIDQQGCPGLAGHRQQRLGQAIHLDGVEPLFSELDRRDAGRGGLPEHLHDVSVARLMPIGDEVQPPLPRISKFEIRNSKLRRHYSIIPSIVVEAEA